jgi:ABC-type cobalamin/Fe3+-siderophores transport system ATPase subunit
MDESLFDFLMLSRINHKNFFRPFTEYDLQLVEQNISYFDLADLQKKRLGELSDIQMKKAMLACSFIRTPQVLLMDNPTAGLDIGTIHTLSREITRSAADGNITAVIASHDLNFIAQIADRIVIMEEGEIVEDGTVDLLNAETIRKYYSVEVFVSRNVYNGRPNIHLFPNN